MRYKRYYVVLPNGRPEVRVHNSASIFNETDISGSRLFGEWIDKEWLEFGLESWGGNQKRLFK